MHPCCIESFQIIKKCHITRALSNPRTLFNVTLVSTSIVQGRQLYGADEYVPYRILIVPLSHKFIIYNLYGVPSCFALYTYIVCTVQLALARYLK